MVYKIQEIVFISFIRKRNLYDIIMQYYRLEHRAKRILDIFRIIQEIIFHIRILISVSLQVYTGYGRTAMMNTKDLFITEDILGKAI